MPFLFFSVLHYDWHFIKNKGFSKMPISSFYIILSFRTWDFTSFCRGLYFADPARLKFWFQLAGLFHLSGSDLFYFKTANTTGTSGSTHCINMMAWKKRWLRSSNNAPFLWNIASRSMCVLGTHTFPYLNIATTYCIGAQFNEKLQLFR